MQPMTRRELAPWGFRTEASAGRVHAIPAHSYRDAFERDRQRIVHSSAFRRLQYKTQVFVYSEGDHYRTRLTHTFEVASLARAAARVLGCNEDLAEAIALCHDLGHPPFGHAGQDALDALMADHGGFEHNRQSLRIVDWLECPYPAHRGLNLSYEVREGLLKHASKEARAAQHGFQSQAPTVEAQLANWVDEIAYTAHDVDDGLFAGLLDMDALRSVPLIHDGLAAAPEVHERASDLRRHALVRWLVDTLVTDLVEATYERLTEDAIDSVPSVRAAKRTLVVHRKATAHRLAELKRYLHAHFYGHHRVVRMSERARRVLEALFASYLAEPRQLPPEDLARVDNEGLHTVICDYLAGLTDRSALEMYAGL